MMRAPRFLQSQNAAVSSPGPQKRPATEHNGQRRLRVIVADDHLLFRQGLLALLSFSEDLEVIGDYCSAEAVLESAFLASSDVLITDVQMPGMTVEQLVRTLARTAPSIRIVVLTMYGDPVIRAQLLRAGADAYLIKTQALEDLLIAIRSSDVEPVGQVAPADLTRRELEVLWQVSHGLQNSAVADALHISTGTVKRHLYAIMHKLGVDSRWEAVQRAEALGFLGGQSF